MNGAHESRRVEDLVDEDMPHGVDTKRMIIFALGCCEEPVKTVVRAEWIDR